MKELFACTSRNMKGLIIFNILMGVIGFLLYFSTYFLHMLVVYFILSTLFNVGIHRYFAHNAYETNRFWHSFLALTTPLVVAGSPISFAAAHLPHHKFADKDLDPVGKNIGILNTLFFNFELSIKNSIRVPNRLLNDPIGKFVHRFYILLFVMYYTLIASFSIEAVFVFSSSVMILLSMYFMVNYITHIKSFANYRNFNTNDTSQNNIFQGWFGGEWHNNHHRYPGAWNQKIRWWELDTSSFFIRLIKK
jgi:stearoyl-CoA desaturase (delta-9 desaturase)